MDQKGKVKFYFRKSCWKLNCGNSSCYRAIDMAVILRNIRCAHQKVSDKALLKKFFFLSWLGNQLINTQNERVGLFSLSVSLFQHANEFTIEVPIVCGETDSTSQQSIIKQ